MMGQKAQAQAVRLGLSLAAQLGWGSGLVWLLHEVSFGPLGQALLPGVQLLAAHPRSCTHGAVRFRHALSWLHTRRQVYDALFWLALAAKERCLYGPPCQGQSLGHKPGPDTL